MSSSPNDTALPTAVGATAYDAWFRQQVQASINDTSPGLPHDVAMAHVWQVLRNRQQLKTDSL
jgi:hypothetical protein